MIVLKRLVHINNVLTFKIIFCSLVITYIFIIFTFPTKIKMYGRLNNQ